MEFMRRLDETSFEWVNAETFVGLDKFQGKPCQVYKMYVPISEDNGYYIFAYIDPLTLLPLGTQVGTRVGIFQFAAEIPPEPLVLPPDFRAKFEQLRGYMIPKGRS